MYKPDQGRSRKTTWQSTLIFKSDRLESSLPQYWQYLTFLEIFSPSRFFFLRQIIMAKHKRNKNQRKRRSSKKLEVPVRGVKAGFSDYFTLISEDFYRFTRGN